MPLSPERQALLDKQRDEYIARMESPNAGNDYSRIDTRRLLVLEAINDWSAHALAEGGDVDLTYGGTNPCCATEEESLTLAKLMHQAPAIFYPVSGFVLSDADELRFIYVNATYRLAPHTGGTRGDAARIAERRHVRDVDAAMQLWVECATEDCMAYLFHQMDIHNLNLEDEECTATRGIVASAIHDRFSPGQVWSAMWRSVKDAAALSTREYYSKAKASRTIPKKIDKVLTQAASSTAPFEAYDRVAAVPMAAALTLFLHRFGISDNTTGAEARARLEADAAKAEPETTEDELDNGRGLVAGKFHFFCEFTPLDQLLLSCFEAIQLESREPDWDGNEPEWGHIYFTMEDPYAFDGKAFGDGLLALLKTTPPTASDIERHAAAAAVEKAKGNEFVDTSGRQQAFQEVLGRAGIASQLATKIWWVVRYPTEPEEIVDVVQQLPLPSGLVGIRTDSAHVFSNIVEHSSRLGAGDLQLSIPQSCFEPAGNDRGIIEAIAANDHDMLAYIIGTGLCNLVHCSAPERRGRLLLSIAHRLQQEGERLVHSSTV
ncbi:hypothetical protein NQS38_00700 [Ralstonia pseudosolanacearum]|uniref:hypothetical protein n=1 Tax=Ralstonia pseudosolanacearum TaxID=1310165 RepID=UPI0013C2DF5E|nr:hypothetical protein [Ralstonia pseudosolanacearum]UYR06909.1 hypothetical protein NQS38_00700 [Ralstonia pseudosolanacearum]